MDDQIGNGGQPPHIDAGRLRDVIDGLEALSETESRHLTRCKDCLEAARLAAREVVRRRRECWIAEARRPYPIGLGR